MKISTRRMILTACMAATGVVFGTAAVPGAARLDLMKLRNRVHSEKAATADKDFRPSCSFDNTGMTGELDAPGGEVWSYAAYFDYEQIPADPDNGIYYTDYILRHYTFDIFDAERNPVGRVSAPMEYADDEQRVGSIDIAPAVSRNFFNTDDKIEIVVGMSVNTKQPGMNRYRSVVYSVDPSKSDPDAPDTPVFTFDRLVGDIVEGPDTFDGRDNFFVTFLEDYYPDTDINGEETTFWDYICAAKVDLTIYSRAKDASGPREIGKRSVPLLQLPGDQESTPFMMSFVRDGKMRFVVSSLQEPIWERYDDPINSEMVQRAGNKLNVEFLTATPDALVEDHTVSIDIEKDESDPRCIASFYGVGDLRYMDDLLYDAPCASAGRPALLMTRSNYNPSSDNSSPSYFLYDHEGKLVHELSLYCDAAIPMSDIEGFEPQVMFMNNENGAYVLRFVDLYSGKERFSMGSEVEIDPADGMESLLLNMDRTPEGDSYKYAVEMALAEMTDDGNLLIRVLWLDDKGEIDRVDRINTGRGVQYGKLYIERDALRPESFHSDSAHEYLVLVKRGSAGDELTEELLLAQPVSEENPEGKTLLHLVPEDRGALSGIIPDLGCKNPTLTVYYFKDLGGKEVYYSRDVYDLPLDGNSGVESVAAPAGTSFTMAAGVLRAAGEIRILTVDGTVVAESSGSFDTTSLPAGIYIATSGAESLKICVK